MRTGSMTADSRLFRVIATTSIAIAALTAAANGDQQPPGPGDGAPPITLNALTNAPEGAEASWDAWGEGTTVIEFWGTWCGPCVAAIPHLNELHDAFAPKGVNFLSVTFEEPEHVDRFRERMAINTWIGHDMDRVMVDAYGVHRWPTTFIVRDGVIIARTHPSALSHDRLTAIVEGGDDPEPDTRRRARGIDQDADQVVGADGRPTLTGGITAGIDPYSMLQDESPTVQVIVRKAGDTAMGAFDSNGMTLLGGQASSILPTLLNRPSYAIIIDPEVTDERFDVIYRVPQGQRDALMPLVRDLVAAGMGVRFETEQRKIPAYELRLAEGGLKLEPGLEQASGSGMSSDGVNIVYTSASMPFDLLVRNIAGFVSAPVTDQTGLEGNYFINLTLPMDRDAVPAALEEATGLKLVPVEKEIEVIVVKPAE